MGTLSKATMGLGVTCIASQGFACPIEYGVVRRRYPGCGVAKVPAQKFELQKFGRHVASQTPTPHDALAPARRVAMKVTALHHYIALSMHR
jgi:hypothetical protein